MYMNDNVFVQYNSPEEYAAAFRGMLDTKRRWLEQVKQRKQELGLSV